MGDTSGAVAQPDMTRDTTGMGGMPVDTANQSPPSETPKSDTAHSGVDSAK